MTSTAGFTLQLDNFEGPFDLLLGLIAAVANLAMVDPSASLLETAYAAVIESDQPLIIQFTRMDTGFVNRALMGTTAYSE